MQLIQGWNRAWRLTSVQAAALLVLLSVVQQEVLPLFQFAIPEHWWPWISASFGAAIILLRLIAQPGALTGGPESGGAP